MPVSVDMSGRPKGHILAWGQAGTELSIHTLGSAIFISFINIYKTFINIKHSAITLAIKAMA